MPLAAVICAVRHCNLKSTPQINHSSGLHVQLKSHLSHTQLQVPVLCFTCTHKFNLKPFPEVLNKLIRLFNMRSKLDLKLHLSLE